MSLEKEHKINSLLRGWPQNAVYLTSWLVENGYSHQLLSRYKKSNWITSLNNGAYVRSGDSATIEGAVFALQSQSHVSIHPGGKSALNLLGKAHYLEFSRQQYILFGNENERIPSWLTNYNWEMKLNYYPTSFLPADFGFTEVEINGFSIKVSGAARAIMECLYLAPKKQDLKECYELMEGLNNLRPNQVQPLLEACKSVKVKRLFLYLANKCRHPWLEFVSVENIDLGKGKRQIVADGVYDPKYKITIPKNLVDE
ncbi:type IV toxin-antitoxin system AbiEi family antitoxin [uncultured Winogradskyella sp.]|uniref:type IV toxin-antitoxin system AbiEi family antitoxin n=1 Tax=uncultured Winogradskyella sp. TaxID=395353 RepID=UPI002631BB8A|nr:type IV toxin-antitoxin system AbiEi family antitoxin [uncultured Winogradskyella sp.]